MKLDTLSLLFVLFLACCGLSGAMLLAWRFLLPLRLLGLWAIGIGMYGSGVLLILLREQIPGVLSLLVANLLVIACYSLFWVGISRHCNKKPHYGLLGLLLLFFVPVYSWYSWVTPDIAVRTVLIRILLLMLLGAGLATLLRNRTAPLSRMERALVATLLFDGCFRLFVLCFQLANFSHKMPIQQNMVASISSMTSLVSMIAWAMVAVLLALEQANLELQQALVEREEQVELNSMHQERLQALLEVSQFPATEVQELLDYALEKVTQITGSLFGYIYHYHDDREEFVLNSWSRGVMPACSVADPQRVCQLEKTGIWGEAVRQRRTILMNDFAAEHPLKKGYPEGHVPLTRFLTVPIFDHEQRIVAVVGVANKELPYTGHDVLQLELMMAEVWRITKRLELEQKLIRAGREWQTTFDALSDSVCLLDPDQRVLRCNLASTRFFGRGFKQIIGEYCWKLVHGTDHPIESCPMVRAKQSRRSESRIIFERGRWLHVTVDPLLNDAGELTGAVLIIHDETERLAAEQNQRELLAMLEAVENELYVFNPDTLLFEFVNRSAQRNLGYQASQLLQMTPLDLKPFTKQQLVALLAPLLSGDLSLQRFETSHRRADGSCYPVEVNLQLVRTDSGSRFLAVVHDITERQKTEQRLQSALQEANHFRTALDHVGAFIYLKDLESRYVYANRPTLELFGCSADELTGSPDSRFFPPETVEQLHRIDQRVFAGERTTEEVTVEQPDGSRRIYLELKTPFYTDSSNSLISGLLGISTDISDLKQSQQQLREMQAQLLQNEKMASIGQLSAGIAHEINNPMGFINSNLGTLVKYVEKFDRYTAALEAWLQEQHREEAAALRAALKMDYVQKDIHLLLQESAGGAERVMQIVQDLKTFARSDSSRIGRADINQCLDSTINIIWNQIKYVAELKREYGELPKPQCNIQQINQVFMNLLANAAHAIEERGKPEPGLVTVRTWADNENIYIAVSDTGCGIPAAIRSRIFEPFFTTKEVGKGTGLGLSISYEIIKKHGGELTVASEEGSGTTFTVRLPIKAEQLNAETQ